MDYKLFIMENIDYIYGDDTVSINGDVLNKDFDEVDFDLVEVDDSDDDAAEMFDY